MPIRAQVYQVIDGERDYQDAKYNAQTTTSKGEHTPEEWMIYIFDYALESLHFASRMARQDAEPRILDNARKIAAMAVKCMEQNGAPEREYVETKD